jgi:hypothetical protein
VLDMGLRTPTRGGVVAGLQAAYAKPILEATRRPRRARTGQARVSANDTAGDSFSLHVEAYTLIPFDLSQIETCRLESSRLR